MKIRIITAAAALALLGAACAGTATATSSTTAPQPTTSAPELPSGTDHLEVGETWATEIFVGCGSPRFFNDTWWVVTTALFDHPDYPAGWPVQVLDQGAVDGPDAIISATITLVAPDRIEVQLANGTAVAVYEPGEPFFCG